DFTGETEFEPFWLWMQFAHQDYLQIAIELGPAGFLFWAILLGGAVFRAAGTLRRSGWNVWANDTVLLYSLALSLGALLLHAAGDFPLQIPSIQLYGFVLAGLCWS